MKNILLYLWQLPQNLLGLIFTLIYKSNNTYKLDNGSVVYFSDRFSGGISLGKYSIINSYYMSKFDNVAELLDSDIVKHEAVGHALQSKLLGPFYLLIIGLPSIIWAGLYGAIIPYTENGYYKFYTEKWADKLAGIIRR